jgi:hypothetical protein
MMFLNVHVPDVTFAQFIKVSALMHPVCSDSICPVRWLGGGTQADKHIANSLFNHSIAADLVPADWAC